MSYQQICIILFLLLPMGTTHAGDWVLAESDDGIDIYLRDVPDSGIQEFRASVTISSSLDSIMAVFSDTQACPEWFHQCDQALQVMQTGFADRVNYQVSDFPFPADDRDILFQTLLTQDAITKTVMMTVTAQPDYCVGKSSAACQQINAADYVRMRKAAGFYRLELTDGGVQVTWQQHTEPGGSLPDWLVNAMVVDIPRNTLKGLRVIVQREKYQKAQLIYQQGVVVGFANKP